MEYHKESDEVYYASDAFPIIGRSDIEFLKARARENARLRCRLCVHPSVDDHLHEMVIVFHKGTYFRPLRHRDRPQSFQVVEGDLTLAILDDDGAVVRTIEMSAQNTEAPFKTRLPPGQWYAFVIHSEWLVVQEITTGPMESGEREYAPFAPEEGNAAAPTYAADLRLRATSFRR
jgi:cupin fold WbuC family metalloprotein